MIDFDGTHKYSQGLIETKYIPSIQGLQQLTLYLSQQGMSSEEIINELKDFKWDFHLNGVTPASLISLIIKKGKQENIILGSFDDVILYETEIKYLKSISDEIIRKILYLSLIVSKWNNHPSGWIRYDRDFLFDFWNLKYAEKDKNTIMQQCCQQGMDLRVIGSKLPIICFKINFKFVDANPVKILHKESDIRLVYQELFEVEK